MAFNLHTLYQNVNMNFCGIILLDEFIKKKVISEEDRMICLTFRNVKKWDNDMAPSDVLSMVNVLAIKWKIGKSVFQGPLLDFFHNDILLATRQIYSDCRSHIRLKRATNNEMEHASALIYAGRNPDDQDSTKYVIISKKIMTKTKPDLSDKEELLMSSFRAIKNSHILPLSFEMSQHIAWIFKTGTDTWLPVLSEIRSKMDNIQSDLCAFINNPQLKMENHYSMSEPAFFRNYHSTLRKGTPLTNNTYQDFVSRSISPTFGNRNTHNNGVTDQKSPRRSLFVTDLQSLSPPTLNLQGLPLQILQNHQPPQLSLPVMKPVPISYGKSPSPQYHQRKVQHPTQTEDSPTRIKTSPTNEQYLAKITYPMSGRLSPRTLIFDSNDNNNNNTNNNNNNNNNHGREQQTYFKSEILKYSTSSFVSNDHQHSPNPTTAFVPVNFTAKAPISTPPTPLATPSLDNSGNNVDNDNRSKTPLQRVMTLTNTLSSSDEEENPFSFMPNITHQKISRKIETFDNDDHAHKIPKLTPEDETFFDGDDNPHVFDKAL